MKPTITAFAWVPDFASVAAHAAARRAAGPAFLGGAVAVNLRADMPLLSNTLFGVYVGSLFWLGYWLSDARARALSS